MTGDRPARRRRGPALDELAERVEAFIARYDLVPDGVAIDVALSGGNDSVALLAVLAELAEAHRWRLRAHHVRHGLRDDAHDAAVARRSAEMLSIPFISTDVDVAPVEGAGPEARARRARYEALEAAARRADVTFVATAHHGDDNVETVLMRLARGTGIDGLGGIPVERDLGGDLRIVRPLLGCSREQLCAVVEEEALPTCVDPTNADPGFLRNRIRANVMPALAALRPGAMANARRSVLRARLDVEALSALADAAARRGHVTDEPAWYAPLSLVRELGPEGTAQLLRHASTRVVAGHMPGATAIGEALDKLGPWRSRGGAPAPGRSGLWRDARVELGRDAVFAVVRALDATSPEAPPPARLVSDTVVRWGATAYLLSSDPDVDLPAHWAECEIQVDRGAIEELELVGAGALDGLLGTSTTPYRALGELGVPTTWRDAHPSIRRGDGRGIWLAPGPRGAWQAPVEDKRVLICARRWPWYAARWSAGDPSSL